MLAWYCEAIKDHDCNGLTRRDLIAGSIDCASERHLATVLLGNNCADLKKTYRSYMKWFVFIYELFHL